MPHSNLDLLQLMSMPAYASLYPLFIFNNSHFSFKLTCLSFLCKLKNIYPQGNDILNSPTTHASTFSQTFLRGNPFNIVPYDNFHLSLILHSHKIIGLFSIAISIVSTT